MFKKFFKWIFSPLKSLVKKQHDERKSMPKYYHDKLCFFEAWIPEEEVNQFNRIIVKLFFIALIGSAIYITFKTR